MLSDHANALERLRKTAQILIDEVGADGPMNADEAASKAVALIRVLRAERDQLREHIATSAQMKVRNPCT